MVFCLAMDPPGSLPGSNQPQYEGESRDSILFRRQLMQESQGSGRVYPRGGGIQLDLGGSRSLVRLVISVFICFTVYMLFWSSAQFLERMKWIAYAAGGTVGVVVLIKVLAVIIPPLFKYVVGPLLVLGFFYWIAKVLGVL